MRLSDKQIERIKRLSLRNKSIRSIARELDLNVTTVLSYKKNSRLKEKKMDFRVWNPLEIGEMIGAFAGDGSYYYSRAGRSGNHICRYHFNVEEEEYVNELCSLLERSGLNVFKYKVRGRNNIDIKMNSKEIDILHTVIMLWVVILCVSYALVYRI